MALGCPAALKGWNFKETPRRLLDGGRPFSPYSSVCAWLLHCGAPGICSTLATELFLGLS